MGLASFATSSDELWAPPQVDTFGQFWFPLNSYTYVCSASYLPLPAAAIFPLH